MDLVFHGDPTSIEDKKNVLGSKGSWRDIAHITHLVPTLKKIYGTSTMSSSHLTAQKGVFDLYL